MILIAAALAIAAFVLGFQIFGIVPTARRIVGVAGGATAVMRDAEMDDEAKEKAIQKAALSMMGGAVSIFLRIAATLLLTLLPIYLLSWVGWVETGDVFAFLARIDVIIGATIVVGGAVYFWSKRPKPAASAYGAMDRFMHRLAFGAPFVQATAADMEDNMFAGDLTDIPERPPVFITSLPRAGTTIILNALHELPQVATHLYRDMPFIMAPLLWSRMSGGFQKDSELAERAHGDGIKVGFDSPEAFEEVIWRHHWPAHYGANGIRMWHTGDADADATAFLTKHFRKIVALRRGPKGRYVSKNNGNIARLALLRQMYPDAAIIVPVRDPGEHAASLLRQHLNFLDQHTADPFVKTYMEDIGHLEFGALHRPILFDGFDGVRGTATPSDLDYWLAYWIAAMEHVLAAPQGLLIVTDTALQDAPQKTMSALCNRAGLDPENVDFTTHFRKIDKKTKASDFDAGLMARAQALYDDLTKISIS